MPKIDPPKKDSKTGLASPHDPDALGKIGIPGNAAKGAKLFKAKCAQCHACEKGVASKQGPNLYGMFGRPAGKGEDYPYTSAQVNSGIVWTEAFLVEYLQNPKTYVPGTKMIFAGQKPNKDMAHLVEYMREACRK